MKNLNEGKNKEIQQYKKKISALKQKFLFYLSYLKEHAQQDFTEIAEKVNF
jgi:hypothetical protein